MIRIVFDFIIDSILWTGHSIVDLPNLTKNFWYKIDKLLGIIGHHISGLPYTISLKYRFKRMWYPIISDFDFNERSLDREKKEWMNAEIGVYRWKVIKRNCRDNERTYYTYTKQYLCFRYKTDAMAFKLRWEK